MKGPVLKLSLYSKPGLYLRCRVKCNNTLGLIEVRRRGLELSPVCPITPLVESQIGADG